jgi:hypothetical protein
MACTIRGISTEEVLRAFDQDHIIKPENSNQYARELLEKAGRQFGGVWAQMFLCREAWGLSGKFEPGQYDKGQSVKAYVAGWQVA